MVEWHHRHEFEYTPGVDDGQGGLVSFRLCIFGRSFTEVVLCSQWIILGGS